MAKPKIALVFDDSLDRADGVQQQLRLMGKWLHEHGWPATYICSGTRAQQVSGLEVISLADSWGVSANQNRLRLPFPVSRRQIKRVLVEQKIELVHITLPFSPWLGGRVIKAAMSAGLPVVGTFHTYPASAIQRLGSRLYGWLYRRRLKKFDRLISVSEPTAQSVRELYGVQSQVVPNFVDVASFKLPTKSIVKAEAQLVFVGRLVERKGPQYLIDALGYLKASGYPAAIRTTIVGDGPMRSQLENQAREQGLAEQVEFAGFVSEEEKAKYLAQAALAVYPATGGEAFGIVLLEAMSADALVLAGDNAGYRSVIKEERQLVDVQNTAEFAQRIGLLLDDEKLRQSLLAQQRQNLDGFDVNNVMPLLAKTYGDMLALKAKVNHT